MSSYLDKERINDRLKEFYQHNNQKTLMEILKVHQREVIFGNFIAFLLNPKASHQLGDLFLQAFFQTKVKAFRTCQQIENYFGKHRFEGVNILT